jgi:hypothetical protein
MRQNKKVNKRDGKAIKPLNRERVALWLGMILIAFLSVVLLFALLRQDTTLIGQTLPALINVLNLILQQVFNKGDKK